MFILGMDIGYSAIKSAYGNVDVKIPETFIRAANAGPSDRMPSSLSGMSTNGNSDIRIDLDGEEWSAGVDPGTLQGWTRELHREYTTTKSYKALFYATLALMPVDTIDMLVTGLPVHLYNDDVVKNDLIERLTGEHKISAKRTVTVKAVKALPQPAGAYMDLARNYKNVNLLKEGRCVVIDPGHFSVDYVVIENGSVRDSTSGTSLKAMSVVLTRVNELIAKDYGSGPGTDRIESALQKSKDSVLVSGRDVTIKPYFDKASNEVSNEALVSMKKDMRQDDSNVDLLLITGGGALSFIDAAKVAFPSCSNIEVPEIPQLANARGFWEYGKVSI
jgi:plasmid segregation protein ParM